MSGLREKKLREKKKKKTECVGESFPSSFNCQKSHEKLKNPNHLEINNVGSQILCDHKNKRKLAKKKKTPAPKTRKKKKKKKKKKNEHLH